MSDRAEVKLTILEAVVKGYHECSFTVRVGDKFVVKQKRGDRGPALRVTDHGRGQLGHLQHYLVTVLWPLMEKVEVQVCVSRCYPERYKDSLHVVLSRSCGNRSFRQRVVSPTVVSQTCRSQFANIINIDMSTYVLTVQFRILTLCLNYWV